MWAMGPTPPFLDCFLSCVVFMCMNVIHPHFLVQEEFCLAEEKEKVEGICVFISQRKAYPQRNPKVLYVNGLLL